LSFVNFVVIMASDRRDGLKIRGDIWERRENKPKRPFETIERGIPEPGGKSFTLMWGEI
jgi:hypothetical protein